MTDISVSIAEVGTILASNGTVTSITFQTHPQTPGYYFTLVDVDADGNHIDDIFNMQTSSMPFPTGTVFPLYGHPFTNLVLQSISPEGVFLVSTNP